MADTQFLSGVDNNLLALWIAGVSISIGLAVGINLYRNRKENKERARNEAFFAIRIKNNMESMKQYFLDIERETTNNEDYNDDNKDMMDSLKTCYIRNEQEMKDILYQTKLYLPLWTSLSTNDKAIINDILDTFSWLLYDYYQVALPETLRENKVLTSRSDLYKKKESLITNTRSIIQKYS